MLLHYLSNYYLLIIIYIRTYLTYLIYTNLLSYLPTYTQVYLR